MQRLGSNPTLQTGENNAQASRQKRKTKSGFAVNFFFLQREGIFMRCLVHGPLVSNSAFSEVKENDANIRNCQP
jgi:hypothetical protein